MTNSADFEHDGIQYRVSALSEFQEAMVGYLLSDLGKAIYGSWDDTPSTQMQLMVYFVRWNLGTTIDGVRFNFLTDITKEDFEIFCGDIAQDSELASKWMNAYKEVNQEQTDPNELNAEPQPVTA